VPVAIVLKQFSFLQNDDLNHDLYMVLVRQLQSKATFYQYKTITII